MMETRSENPHVLSEHTLQLILSNAQFHSDLQETLRDLQVVPSQLEEHKRYMVDLERSLKNVKKSVAQCAETTKREREEHRDLNDSTMRRLAYKMVKKEVNWEMKKETENRKYIEALEKEMIERQNQQVLETSIDEAKRLESELREKKERIGLIQGEIEDLYEKVFNGARREFPRDQQLRQQLADAKSTHDSIQARLKSNSTALPLLSQASGKIQDSWRRTAHDEYHGLFTNGRGERQKKLNKAAKRASEFEQLLRKARLACSEIGSVPQLPIRDMYKTGKYFDAPLSAAFKGVDTDVDLARYRKEITHVKNLVQSEIHYTTERIRIAETDLAEASEVLTSCKTELQEFRRATFESIVANPNASSVMDETHESQAIPLSTIDETRNRSHDSLPLYTATRPLSETEILPPYNSLMDR
ncbi:hypothetical protein K435DRAFT_747815 [Dendrothele bispora CBS 962.96]|uniref:Uncharacterized protein n=1 Tax=Dendrothele bispora (strain CBS 962.96) TaxID=1314807 RepID=A0A4S8ML02_DENBC|nr:hypothetical protein K435DRAFT_747815 [Dendrothele bispora CBS 962.96]